MLSVFGRLSSRDDFGRSHADAVQRKLTSRLCGLGKLLLGLSLFSACMPAWASFTLVANGVVNQLPTGLSTIDTLSGAVLDSSGNLYVADSSSNEIIKIASNGVTTSVLSITGLSTALSSPRGLTMDSSGNLYIADAGNNRIVEISPLGAGSVISTGSITLISPQGVAIDVSGNIFISDTGNSRIIKISSGGTAAVFTITSLAPALSVQRGIAVDPQGNLYIADTGNSRVVKVSPTGVAGTPLTTARGTALEGPSGVAVSNNGVLYIADTNTTENGNPTPGRVVIVDSQGDASELLTGYPVFNSPRAVAVSSMGNVYVVDNGGTANAGRVQSFQSITIDNSDTFTSSVGFGHIPLGNAGTSITIPFDVGLGVTLASIKIFTAGTQNLDYTIANDSTCVTGSEYGQNTNCTVDVTFSPTAAGLRKGALVVSYGSGSLTVPLYGIADASVVALSPAVASVVNIGSTTLNTPFQTTVDGAGNIYVTNYGANIVDKIPAGGGTGTAVSTGSFTLSQPTGVAVDASGNLFIADYGHSRIIEVPTSGSALLFAISGLSQSINLPTALSFDSAGNLYVTDYGGGRMVEVNPYGQGTVLATGSITFAGTNITGSAVDTLGNVYIADRTNNRIVKVTPLGIASVLNLSSVGTLNNPQGVAVDPSNNVYVMDSSNQRVIRITTSGAIAVMPFSGPTIGTTIFGITLDSNGNVLLGDWANNRLVKVNVGQSALTFASTGVGNTSSDSPKTTTVTDLGDLSLILSANISYTPNFSENTGDTNLCTSTTTLATGTLCDVAINFTPQAAGSLSANLVVTDNNLNVNGSTQSVAASGTGINLGDTTAVAVATNPTSANIGQPITVSATVTDTTTGHSSTVPTGPVTFMDTVGSTAISLNGGSPVTLSSGVATLTGVALSGAGTHTITANYAGVNGSFIASTNTTTLAVTTTPAVIAGPASQPVQVTVGQAGSVVITITGPYTGFAVPTGTLSYSLLNASNTSVASGTATLTAGSGSSSATIPIANSLTPGTYTLNITYSGDSNYAASSGPITIQIVVGQITPTISWTAPSGINYGTTLASVLTATAVNGSTPISGSFSYTATPQGGTAVAVSGATVLGGGTYMIAATFTPTDTTTYTSASSSVAFTVAKAAVAVALITSADTVLEQNSVTFTATVTSTAGTPGGSVAFYDATTLLGSGTLSAGVATYSTSALTVGAHSITAQYGGSANYLTLTSSAVTETVENFTLGVASSGTTSATVSPGGTATYALVIGPSTGTTFPAAVTLSVSGLPPGATATLTPNALAAGAGSTNVALVVQVPTHTASLRRNSNLALKLSPMMLGMVLLPFARRKRRSAAEKCGKHRSAAFFVNSTLTLVLLGSALVGLTGCGASNSGFLGRTQTSYTLMVTATSGTLSHSTALTLTVQ